MPKQSKKGSAKRANPFPAMEEEVLDFWDKAGIFEKSVASPPSVNKKKLGDLKNITPPPGPLLAKEGERKDDKQMKDYIFYDGPPFATGTPHYGHIVASLMKDVVPRYWTMQGYRVERRWGWDCHGLPIENIVEKEMKTKSKKDIEELGIDKFNEKCCSKVLAYVEEWKKTIHRLGRWADMENAYKTMDLDYMESIWWVFKELWDKGLIYEDYKSMHICPRCETTLSQAEVAEGYRMIDDLSVTVKFELTSPLPPRGAGQAAPLPPPNPLLEQEGGTKERGAKVYVLAWTTTPWTLIGNVALAVGKDIDYVKFSLKDHPEISDGIYIVSKKDFEDYQKGEFGKIKEDVKVIEELKGKDLVGKEYKSLFDYYSNAGLENRENAFKIYAADFVDIEEGTGVVHIAPAFGEDDMNLGKEKNLPFIQHVSLDGRIKPEAKDFAGLYVKPINDPMATDKKVVEWLKQKGVLFSQEEYEHSYPHCWRCETPLLNYATSSWFVKVTDIKDKAIKLADKINWTPKHIKEGRFGQWLEGARDWSISRQRFWASVIPIWKCDALTPNPSPNGRGEPCGEIKVIGSVKEVEDLSGQKIKDLHKHVVDKITFKCEKCGGVMKRIPDVLDCWFESGSMPYAQMHYPFENEKKFEQNFPAEFIAEGVDQTRAWFYYLHVIATAIKNKPAFKNVIVNGIVLAEDGKKMSKKLQNYPDPMEVMDKYGADPLRYYLCASPVMKAEGINFSEKDLVEQTKFFNILLNVLAFYKMFVGNLEIENLEKKDLVNVLDKWITSRLEETKKTVTKKMDNYDLHAIREIPPFINDLSTWYIRRSRDRFKGGDEQDKQAALATTKHVLTELSKLIAPFMPFMAEQIWQRVSGNNFGDENKSVHLEKWPNAECRMQNAECRILEEMEMVRKIVEMGLAKRDEAGIKVRQPLAELRIKNYELRNEYENLIKDELNVKSVKVEKGKGELSIELSLKLTPELKQEGIKRELVRAINSLRKDAGMTIQDRAVIYYQTDSDEVKKVFAKFGEEIKKDTLSDEIQVGDGGKVKINGEEVELKVEKK